MKYVSLFAGIGGFDLALNSLGHECVFANDIDRYCKIIYDKNFTDQVSSGNGEGSAGDGKTDASVQSVESEGQNLRSIGNLSNNHESGATGQISHSSSPDRDSNGGGKADQAGDEKTGKRLESQTGQTPSSPQGSTGEYDNNRANKGAVYLDTRSITDINADEIPAHDLLVGGFPCQAFSIAGKRQGFNEIRGTLFFDITRILKHHQTKYFILENVKGLLNHDGGRTFRVIIKTLTELGYDLEWQVLNSKNFGVPQNRERVYIVGHLRGEPRPQIFPFGSNNGEDTEQITSTTIDANYWKGIDNHGQRTAIAKLQELTENASQGYRVYDSGGLSTTLASQAGGVGAKTVLYQVGQMKIRRLTPLECERLQGFPDGWTSGQSDTQRYKMLGNAVTVNVVKAVAKGLPRHDS